MNRTASNISGFPRIGAERELKFATERYWKGDVSLGELQDVGRSVRRKNLSLMRGAGIDLIPSNDFSFYDQVLDTTAMVGAVPERYAHEGGPVDIDTYFAMARGKQSEGVDVTAMEMLKWFDTNYHYIVPELGPETEFTLSTNKVFEEFEEAKALGITSVPVLIGAVSYLLLSKPAAGLDDDFNALTLLPRLLNVYQEVIAKLGELGAEWVQLDEPKFVEDASEKDLVALRAAYEQLARVPGRPKLLIKTYFDHVGDSYGPLAGLPVEGIGLDFHRGPKNLEIIESNGGLKDKVLFAGIVDGRSVWINDLQRSLDLTVSLQQLAPEVVVSTSCSLLHVPIDLDPEPGLDDEVRSWLAFAKQKVAEVATIARGVNEGQASISQQIEANRTAIEARLSSPRTVNPQVRARVDALTDKEAARASEYSRRRRVQRERLPLPLFPTTTIGSFPQTDDIRRARAKFQKKELSTHEYQEEIKREIDRVVRFQEKAGLDVLVHGEAERNDMVQYFGEQLEGYVFTKNAWVQSYGSRYVRPPILYGDVFRPFPMTIEWITYAQSLTEKPLKGMLTGPVTILMWSFVRDDLEMSEVCKQIALAIRDEVIDLEAAGQKIIQVDEPALREGLPLRKDRWAEYLDWAVFCFRVATSGVRDETQIQTHLCYSEFGDILQAVDDLDADVNLMWCARAGMRLLDELQEYGYPREVGPGVYDIHSPRVPSVDEMAEEIRMATKRLDTELIWVNPDCGLKTREWREVDPALKNMVQAARKMREEVTST